MPLDQTILYRERHGKRLIGCNNWAYVQLRCGRSWTCGYQIDPSELQRYPNEFRHHAEKLTLPLWPQEGRRKSESGLASKGRDQDKTPFIGPKPSVCGIGWPTAKRSMWTWSKGNIIADRDSILTHLWLINQNETFPDSRRLPSQHLTPSEYQIHCHWTLCTLSDIR